MSDTAGRKKSSSTGNSQKKKKSLNKKTRKWYEKNGWIIFWLIFFFPLGLFLMWKYSNWNKIVKLAASLFFAISILSGISFQNINDIVLSADTGYRYNIYSEVQIEIETKPSGCAVPESAFFVSGGELRMSEDSAIFVAEQPGEYEVFAEYEGVKSNTLVIKYEDKEAIAQAEFAALAEAKAKEEALAKARAEEEAAEKAKAKEEALAKARAEEEALAKARAEEAMAREEEEKRAATGNVLGNSYVETETESISQTDAYQKGQMVWLSATGQKYHNIPDCGNMNPNRARQVTLSDAVNGGYGACKNCFR